MIYNFFKNKIMINIFYHKIYMEHKSYPMIHKQKKVNFKIFNINYNKILKFWNKVH